MERTREVKYAWHSEGGPQYRLAPLLMTMTRSNISKTVKEDTDQLQQDKMRTANLHKLWCSLRQRAHVATATIDCTLEGKCQEILLQQALTVRIAVIIPKAEAESRPFVGRSAMITDRQATNSQPTDKRLFSPPLIPRIAESPTMVSAARDKPSLRIASSTRIILAFCSQGGSKTCQL